MPSEHSPYALGDIRDFIKAGEMSDLSSSLHSEKVIITMAARKGIPLEGTSLYVSTFPCSDCANWVACSGIKKVFFGGGHASFQGEDVLRSFGVELVYVK
jgi:dCMP deaminase